MSICFIVEARCFFVLSIGLLQMVLLQVAGEERQPEALTSAEEELRWRASVLAARILPGSDGVLDIFPLLSAAYDDALKILYCCLSETVAFGVIWR